MELVIRVDTNELEDISDLKIMADALNKKSSAPKKESNLSEKEISEKNNLNTQTNTNQNETPTSLTSPVSTPTEPQISNSTVLPTVLPTAAAKEYTRDEIARALVQLRDLKGLPELMSVLSHFGVNNLMAIPTEKYNELVAILNEKGVKV